MLENNHHGQMGEQHLTDNTAGLQILLKDAGKIRTLLKYHVLENNLLTKEQHLTDNTDKYC